MDRLRKMSSKVFKKSRDASPAPPVPVLAERGNLKHSRSMPLHATHDPSKPVYRGRHPLKASNIIYPADPVLDISRKSNSDSQQRRGRRRHAGKYTSDSSDEEDAGRYGAGDATGRLLEQFPVPPPLRLAPAPSREDMRARRLNSRPPVENPYRPEDLLPPLLPQVAQFAAEVEANRKAQYRQPLQRSTSTSFSRPTVRAYPHLAHAPPRSSSHHRAETYPPSAQPSYKRSLSNLAAHDTAHGTHTRVVAGPVPRRPVIRQASQPALPDISPYHPAVIRAVCNRPFPAPSDGPSVHRSASIHRRQGGERQRAPSHGSSRSRY